MCIDKLHDGTVSINKICHKPLTSTQYKSVVGVFGPPTSKFVFARLARMVCSKDIRVYTSLDRTSLRLVRCCSCYRHLVYSRGYKRTREGEGPKSLVKGSNGVESC